MYLGVKESIQNSKYARPCRRRIHIVLVSNTSDGLFGVVRKPGPQGARPQGAHREDTITRALQNTYSARVLSPTWYL